MKRSFANKILISAIIICGYFFSIFSGCGSSINADHKSDVSGRTPFFVKLTSEPEGARIYGEVSLPKGRLFAEFADNSYFGQENTPIFFQLPKHIVEEARSISFTVTMPGYNTVIESYSKITDVPKTIHWVLHPKPSEGGGTYIAFSLPKAEQLIREFSPETGYRDQHKDVFQLGGIRQIYGLVNDKDSKEIILVGKPNHQREPLTLDDLVVALRSRFIHKQWPLLSIDPNEDDDLYKVRYEGGIEATKFGADLFEIDYRAKLIGMGHLPSGVPGLPTYWQAWILQELENGQEHYHYRQNRFWFRPMLSSMIVKDEVVAIRGFKLNYSTEITELDGRKIEGEKVNLAAEKHVVAVNELFPELCKTHSCFSRLYGLQELVALAKAFEELNPVTGLSFWLETYPVASVKTPLTVKRINRRYERFISKGGVSLRATALRLKAGDVSALKEAVLNTRPNPESITWSFHVDDWVIPITSTSVEHRISEEYYNRGLTQYVTGQYDQAISDYTKAIEIKPTFAEAYNNRGLAYEKKGKYTQAISDYTKAIEINSTFAEAYNNRGTAHAEKGKPDLAISDYNKALEINQKDADVYFNRGRAHFDIGQYDRAISDYTKAIELKPTLAKAYSSRGTTYIAKGEPDLAISDYNKALEINQKDADVYFNRGFAHFRTGQYDRAVSDYTKAIEINPTFAKAYTNRGLAYASKGRYNQAISDYTKTLEINSTLALVYYNRALAYYYAKKEYDKVWDDIHKAQSLGFQVHPRFLKILREASGRER